MTIGERIKEQRAKLGYSQQQLSNELGVSIDTVKSLEINRAKPSVETLNKLANLFNCSTDYLLGRVDEPHLTKELTWNELVPKLNEMFNNFDNTFGYKEDGLSDLFDRFPRNDDPIPKEEIKKINSMVDEIFDNISKLAEETRIYFEKQNKIKKD